MLDHDLTPLRHTLAHLLAAAVQELYPDAKRSIGPAIEHGFYYDFDFGGSPPGEEDLPRIEKKMRELLPSWEAFARLDVSPQQARDAFADNPYKQELIDEITSKGEQISLYYSGPADSAPDPASLPPTTPDPKGSRILDSRTNRDPLQPGFLDLCRGGHAEHPNQDITTDAFTLTHIAGAYWRGDETKPMLTRIYGLAFPSKKELEAHLAMLKEAKRRDHKILGPQLDLFVFSPLVGSGLPLWTPKGTLVRDLLDDFVWQLRQRYGYEKVEIPHITKKDLYETSGHWDKFKEDLFRITTREGHEFAMKPMNCPHHTQIYARRPWSYRELPQRYANTTMVYRDEQTGELSGLSRVRAITQDDGHVFCRLSQTKDEFLKIWDIIHEFYGKFGFPLQVRLSLHDPNEPDKYLGDAAVWKKAEDMLRQVIAEKEVQAEEGIGEAAFYGPKLDFIATDSLGRKWQVATIQLDMNMPERFDLTCTNEKGEKERIVMIHAAIMGSIERFLSIAIEHFAGVLPTWLAPIQVRIIPVSEKHLDLARTRVQELIHRGVRAEVDQNNESVGKKIRLAETDKIPYSAVLGDKEADGNTLAVRRHGGTDLGAMPLDDLASLITSESSARTHEHTDGKTDSDPLAA